MGTFENVGNVADAALQALSQEPRRITCCVIPAYRARATICEVVRKALNFVPLVVVVDDACPERSGEAVERAFAGVDAVTVLFRESNGGVGAAMKAGIAYALAHGATTIVKIDADDQMDASFIPRIEEMFEQRPDLALIKGNRFGDPSVLEAMPQRRLLGNAALSLLIKLASGYWSVFDPTNGFIALSASALATINWRAFADGYFFELSVLCSFGLHRHPIGEIDMPAIYGDAPSSLSVRRVLVEFPPLLAACIGRRILLQYYLLDLSPASLYLLLGLLLAPFGIIFGAYAWTVSGLTGIPRTAGTVALAAVPLLLGLQMLFSALLYDVAQSPRTVRQRTRLGPEHDEAAYPDELSRIIPVSVRRTGRRVAVVFGAAAVFIAWCLAVALIAYRGSDAVVASTQDFFANLPLILTGLPRNADSLLMTLSFAVAAVFPGYLFTGCLGIRWSSRVERLCYCAVLGLPLFTFIFLGLGSIGLLQPIPLFALTAVSLIGALVVIRRSLRAPDAFPHGASEPRALIVFLSCVLALFLGFTLLASLEFERSFDGMWYHLSEAKRFALHGGFYDLTKTDRMFTAALPHYQEDLYAGLVSMFGLVAAKLLSWVQAVLAIGAILLFCRRYLGSLAFGLACAIVFISTPIVTWSASVAGNDIPQAALALLAIYALLRWGEDPAQRGFLVLAGAFCGYSIGVKPAGIFTLLAACALLVYLFLQRRHSTGIVKPAALFAGAAFAFAFPSLLNLWLWVGNPIYPIGSHGDITFAAYGTPFHYLLKLVSFPVAMLYDPSLRDIVGPLLAMMLPVSLFTIWRVAGADRVVAGAAIFVAVWIGLMIAGGVVEARYAESLMPIGTILLCYPLVWSATSTRWITPVVRGLSVLVIAAVTVLNLPFLLPLQPVSALPGMMGGDSINWDYLYRGEPFFGESPQNITMLQFLNANLSSRDKVYDFDSDLFMGYLYSNVELFFDAPAGHHDWTLLSPDAPAKLKENGITYVVTWTRDLAALRNSAAWPHLQLVYSTAGANPGDDFRDWLFRVRY